MDKPISIHDVNGNVTVTIIEGNNNKTELSIDSYIEKITKDCGLQLIYKDKYKNDDNTSTNFKDWLDGFPINIKSVYYEREFRRNALLDNIKEQLERKGRFLILGESGTSKSIILMEILCDYLKKGYKIFHNLDLGGTTEIKDLEHIENTIIELVENGNSVLVIVDNIHIKTNANTFTLIKKLRDDNEDKLDKIKFLLAAREPEFGWAIDRGIFDSDTTEKFNMLFDNEKRHKLQYFSEEEVRGFLEKYKEYCNSTQSNISIKERAQEIFKDTKGHPIMVRFSVLQNGLENHVKKMYTDYLVENKSPSVERIKSVISCSLYDISSIPLTDTELSENLDLKIPSLQIMNTMIKKGGDIWTTIHPRWDLELFKYMFSLNEADLEIIKESFGQIFMKINDSLAQGLHRHMEFGHDISGLRYNQIHILNTLYNTIAVGKFVDISLIQDMINLDSIISKLDKVQKTVLFANVLGVVFHELKNYSKAIEYYDEAIRTNPDNADAFYNKGLALHNLGKYQEAIECYDKYLKANPDDADTMNNKGLALHNLGKYQEAIECYDKVLKISPNEVTSWDNKGYSLSQLNRIEEAVQLSDKAIELDSSYANAWYNRACYMARKGEVDEALENLEEAIRLDTTYSESAKTDKDFDNIRYDSRFGQLIGI